MMLTPFEALPEAMRIDTVRRYHTMLYKKRGTLILKRLFDILCSLLLLVLLSPVLLVVTAAVLLDSRGPVFFIQQRYTRDMRCFRMIKFRSMVADAQKGPLLTVQGDSRITRVGAVIRRYRIDEFPQLFNVLTGDMTFVGTRPEIPGYVQGYTGEMLATLLLPAGITSRSSILFLDEDELLKGSQDIDQTYIEEILPRKMQYNLQYLERFSLTEDLRILFSTFFAAMRQKIIKEETGFNG